MFCKKIINYPYKLIQLIHLQIINENHILPTWIKADYHYQTKWNLIKDQNMNCCQIQIKLDEFLKKLGINA